MLKVEIIGNVGGEPKIGTTKDGKNFANFSIAQSKTRKEDNLETTWFNVQAYGKQAEIIAKGVYKGSRLWVSGTLVIGKYKDKNGVEKVSHKIIYPEFEFLDKKGSAPSNSEGKEPESQTDFGLDDDIPW